MGQGQPDGKTEKREEKKVVIRVDMDCEACKKKVKKVLKNFPGVDNIDLDMDEQKVTIKGNVDAWKVYEALRKKCGRRTMLLYPRLSKEEEDKAKEDSIINSVNNILESIKDLLNPKPPNTAVELRIPLHCGACARKIKRILLRLDGVTEVEGDMMADKVVVKGRDLDVEALCKRVKQSGKPCELLSFRKEEKPSEKSDEQKAKKSELKEEKEKKSVPGKDKKEKGEKESGNQAAKAQGKPKEEKGEKESGNQAVKAQGKPKEEKGEKESGIQAAKAQGESKEEKGEKMQGKNEGKKNESKKGETMEDKSEKKQHNAGDKKETMNHKNEWEQNETEVMKFVHTPYQALPEYAYDTQIFSDENPNACILM